MGLFGWFAVDLAINVAGWAVAATLKVGRPCKQFSWICTLRHPSADMISMCPHCIRSNASLTPPPSGSSDREVLRRPRERLLSHTDGWVTVLPGRSNHTTQGVCMEHYRIGP